MKKRKGFTLIELLAVIVIIGLLMAIAIPSVTKYITQSRKKTIESSIHEFTTAVTIDVNDSKYDIDKDNTIYAIPIECIELEKGGEDPFGKWMPANDKQWAYVLIQYDGDKREYTYGFTFKDSGGFGLYPTEVSKLKGEGHIKKDLDLNKPTSGSYTNITGKRNWNGFDLEFDTQVKVLWATDDGDGKHSCTIRHDVDMNEVPEYVPPEDDDEEDDTVVSDGTKAYAIYSADDQSLTFVRLDDSVQVKAGDIFLNKTVTAIYTGFEDKSYSSTSIPWNAYVENIKTVSFNDKIKPISTAYWFNNFNNLDEIIGINNLYTSKVTSMRNMFYNVGHSSSVFTLDLGDNFDTSNVTNMTSMFGFDHTTTNTVFTLDLGDKFDTSKVTSMVGMFANAGYKSTKFNLNLGDKFNTKNVTHMSAMFFRTGSSSPLFTLDLGDKFDTSKVTSMNRLFTEVGYSNPNFTFDLGDKFDTSKVTEMDLMFDGVGYSNPNFTLDLGDKFDTSNVTTMSQMFYHTGYSSKNFKLDLGDKFDTSKVTDMSWMFSNTGVNSTSFTLDLGDKFDTSNVTNMKEMFRSVGYSNKNFTFDLGDKFDTSKVTDMSWMFHSIGYNSNVFTLDLGEKFNTSNVTDMSYMFTLAGYNSPLFKVDCSGWNVDKVVEYEYFNNGATSKVIPPTWK